MPVEWSGSGPQLLITLDRTLSTPLRVQVEGQLRDAIQSGRLAAGERVPSSRALATYLGLSRGVVQDCYAQLQAEGYLSSRGGSATRVAATATGPRPSATPSAAASPAPAPGPPRLIASFESGVPDLGLAPRADWAWAVREACRAAPNTAFDYGDARGDVGLRQVLAAYVRRVRAADGHPDQVVVCGGFAQGLDVAALAASGARVAVLTPAHQWPTGVVLAPHRRHELIAWARDCDGMILEDDYDAEFRYDREPIGSMQGLAPDRVINLGTVSKSLAPALRLGWAVVPAAIADDVAAAKAVADRGTPGIDQLALARLIESGRYDRHLRRMRAEYSQRRDVLIEALREHAPHLRLTGLAAGFHAVAHLPEGADETAVVAAARERRVGLFGMGRYRSDPAGHPPQLMFGFGNTGQRAIREGIAAVADLL